MTKPDEDYENPIGEVLDEQTVYELAANHVTASLAAILREAGVSPWLYT